MYTAAEARNLRHKTYWQNTITPLIRTGPVFCAVVTYTRYRTGYVKIEPRWPQMSRSCKTYSSLWPLLCCSAGTPCLYLPTPASLWEGTTCCRTQVTVHARSTQQHCNTHHFIASSHPINWPANELSRISAKIFNTINTKACHWRRSWASSIHPPIHDILFS